MSRRPATDEERLAIAYKMRKAWAIKRGEDPSLVQMPTLEELKPPQRPDGRRRKKTRGEKLKQSISKREQMRAEKGLPPHPTEEEIAEKVRKFNEERLTPPGVVYDSSNGAICTTHPLYGYGDPTNATADPNVMTATTDLRAPTGTALVGPGSIASGGNPPWVALGQQFAPLEPKPSLDTRFNSQKKLRPMIEQLKGMDPQGDVILTAEDWLTILTAIVGGE